MHKDPYLSPEQCTKNTLQLTQQVDVWSFGCLIYEILFGKPPKSYFELMREFN